MPRLLNYWLKEEHIQTKFWNTAILHKELQGRTITEYIVATAATVARSNSTLMPPRHMPDDFISPDDTYDNSTTARSMFQQLYVWASSRLVATRAQSRSRSQTRSESQTRTQSTNSVASNKSGFEQTLETRILQHQNDDPAFREIMRKDLRREKGSTPEPKEPQLPPKKGRGKAT